jgi:chorismate mutase
VRELAGLLGQRLALAEKVAWVKFREGLPVEDREREEALLSRVEELAATERLPGPEARRFFAAQIEASKREQRRLLRGWDRGKPLPEWGALSLRDDVRPALEELTPMLLGSWAKVRLVPGWRWQIYRELRAAGWSWSVAWAAAGI